MGQSGRLDAVIIPDSLLFDLLWPLGKTQQPAHEQWADIDTIAGQHRLRPLLHHCGITHAPAPLREKWQMAHRRSVFNGLNLQAELHRIGAILSPAGLEAVVLKGGVWLWRGWIPPGIRPMRDIDLLLRDEAQAQAAQALLLSAGYVPESPTTPDAKHLPGLRSPTGQLVELHTRVIDAPHDGARAAEHRWRNAALTRTLPWNETGPAPLRVLDDTDTLLHTILHAAIDHQFNNGPLLLIDVEALVRCGMIDWDRLRHDARALDAERAVDLVLTVCQYRYPTLAERLPKTRAMVPPAMLKVVETMMLVDRSAPSEQGWLGSLLAAPNGARLRSLRMMMKRRTNSVKAASEQTGRLARWISR